VADRCPRPGRQMPVDTRRLDKLILDEIRASSRRPSGDASSAVVSARSPQAWYFCFRDRDWFFILTDNRGRAAHGTAAQIAQVHETLVSGRMPVVQVSSIGRGQQDAPTPSRHAPSLLGRTPVFASDGVHVMKFGANKRMPRAVRDPVCP